MRALDALNDIAVKVHVVRLLPPGIPSSCTPSTRSSSGLCTLFETPISAYVTGGATVTTASTLPAGLLLRLGIACALPAPLADVRIIRASLMDASSAVEIANSAVEVQPTMPVNTALGDCSTVGLTQRRIEAGFFPSRGRRALTAASSSSPILRVELAVIGSCTSPALGSAAALTARLTALSLIGNATHAASETGTGTDGVSSQQFLLPFVRAVANASAPGGWSVRLSLSAQSGTSAGLATSGTPLSSLIAVTVAVALAACFCCAVVLALALAWRRRRKNFAAANAALQVADPSSGKGGSVLLVESVNPMHARPPIRAASMPQLSSLAADTTGSAAGRVGTSAKAPLSDPRAGASASMLAFAANRRAVVATTRQAAPARCVEGVVDFIGVESASVVFKLLLPPTALCRSRTTTGTDGAGVTQSGSTSDDDAAGEATDVPLPPARGRAGSRVLVPGPSPALGPSVAGPAQSVISMSPLLGRRAVSEPLPPPFEISPLPEASCQPRNALASARNTSLRALMNPQVNQRFGTASGDTASALQTGHDGFAWAANPLSRASYRAAQTTPVASLRPAADATSLPTQGPLSELDGALRAANPVRRKDADVASDAGSVALASAPGLGEFCASNPISRAGTTEVGARALARTTAVVLAESSDAKVASAVADALAQDGFAPWKANPLNPRSRQSTRSLQLQVAGAQK